MDRRRFTRSVQVRSESYNPDDSTVDLVWTTGASVRRCDPWTGDEFDEVLSLEREAVRMDRLNSGAAPFLAAHDSGSLASVIGSVVAGSASIDGGRGTATVKLSRAVGDRDTVQKIADGIIRSVSVGYWVYAYDKAETDGQVPVWTATDWEPLEISAVPIPADPGAQIRSARGRVAEPSARAATIRRYAAKARLRELGEEHIRAGTSAEEFFNIAAGRLIGRTPHGATSVSQSEYDRGRRTAQDIVQRSTGTGAGKVSAAATRVQRDFAHGATEARKLLGRDDPKKKPGDDEHDDIRDAIAEALEDDGLTNEVVSADDDDDDPPNDQAKRVGRNSARSRFLVGYDDGARGARSLLRKR